MGLLGANSLKLTVAANYDPEIVPELARYPVVEVFGKFPVDFAGGGRPAYLSTPLSTRQLENYVRLLKSHDIEFNYLLNPACTANREWSRSWQKKLMRILARLEDMGISHLTVTTPYLLEAVKSRSSHFKIKVGLYAMVDSVQRAVFWEKLGADSINLECRCINRDLNRLALIRKAVSCDLQLIANHICIPSCPMLGYHQNSIAHASAGSSTLFIDYCFLRCSRMRLEDPSLLIKSHWIRPEDIPAYEQLGYSTFKILERNIPSDQLLKRVEAYSRRSFNGNLAEILLPYGFSTPVKRRKFFFLRHFFKPFQANTAHMGDFLKILKTQGMLFAAPKPVFEIDSSAIPKDFIENFRNRDCSMLDCRTCRYCETIAASAVKIDSGIRRDLLDSYKKIDNKMSRGGLWGV
jgi:collagenase-like PrtC family protease